MIDLLITFVASVLIWLMFLGLIYLWVIDGRIKKEIVIHAIIASVIAWVLSMMLKDVFHTTRPFVEDGVKYLVFWIPKANGAFPSSHTAAAFALSFTVWLHNRKFGTFYLISALLIGIARVMANVHYPMDIAGGAALGILIAFMVEKIHFKFKT